MVVWNWPPGIWSKCAFFPSPRCGKSKKGALNAIGRPSSTCLFALLWKAHPKWWYEINLAGFHSKGVLSLRPDGESRKNALWTRLDDLRQPAFLRCWEKPTQNGGMKPTSQNSIPSVSFRFALIGKLQETRFERHWMTFVNPPFFAAWKSQPKMEVWNRPCGIRSQVCFFRFFSMGKAEKTLFERSWTTFVNSFFALLGKADPKWWHETHLAEFDPKCVFYFRPDGESQKNSFRTRLDDLPKPGFLFCLKKPNQNGCMKPTWWNSIPILFFRFHPMEKSKKRVLNAIYDFLVLDFLRYLEKPHKMVVRNQSRGI